MAQLFLNDTHIYTNRMRHMYKFGIPIICICFASDNNLPSKKKKKREKFGWKGKHCRFKNTWIKLHDSDDYKAVINALATRSVAYGRFIIG